MGAGPRSIRRRANWLNLSTPAGLLLTALSGARPRRTPDGLYVATGYRWAVPMAGAFTVGDVIVTRQRREGADPTSPLAQQVWEHEKRHAAQYAYLGLLFIPVYVAAAGYSWAVGGDAWSYNVFETRADLADGGYHRAELRPMARLVSNRLRRRG